MFLGDGLGSGGHGHGVGVLGKTEFPVRWHDLTFAQEDIRRYKIVQTAVRQVYERPDTWEHDGGRAGVVALFGTWDGVRIKVVAEVRPARSLVPLAAYPLWGIGVVRNTERGPIVILTEHERYGGGRQ